MAATSLVHTHMLEIKVRKRATDRNIFDRWFVHEPWGNKGQIVESDCVVCRLPIGAAAHKRAMEVMELSHLTIHHPRSLLRWFLQTQQFPSA
jgi:hypothetical protein